jgi:hypothetical protein
MSDRLKGIRILLVATGEGQTHADISLCPCLAAFRFLCPTFAVTESSSGRCCYCCCCFTHSAHDWRETKLLLLLCYYNFWKCRWLQQRLVSRGNWVTVNSTCEAPRILCLKSGCASERRTKQQSTLHHAAATEIATTTSSFFESSVITLWLWS